MVLSTHPCDMQFCINRLRFCLLYVNVSKHSAAGDAYGSLEKLVMLYIKSSS